MGAIMLAPDTTTVEAAAGTDSGPVTCLGFGFGTASDRISVSI
jgi:hypothetical protein